MYNVLLITMQILQENQKAPAQKRDQGPLEDLQPSHYEYEPFDAEKTLKTNSPKIKTGSAGEFEMPVMDSYELHAAKPSKITDTNKPKDTSFDKYAQMTTHAANSFNIVTSAVTAVGSAVSKNESFTNFLQGFASLGAKVSMGVNSLFNIYNGHKQKDLSHVIGYGGELVAALLAPYKVLGLIRGMTFSTYQTSNILANIKPMKKSNSYAEYVSQVKERIPTLISKLFKANTYTNIKDNVGVVTGGWGGILSFTGVLGWALSGSTKFGGWVKGVGEVLVDSYQVLTKENWVNKKQFYIGSGLAFIMGSLAEIISKQRNNDPVTMALYFFGSGVGRLLYTISNILRENEYGPGGPTDKREIFDIAKILNFSKPQAAAA